jgi:glutaminyl-peptide cyclotransferase
MELIGHMKNSVYGLSLLLFTMLIACSEKQDKPSTVSKPVEVARVVAPRFNADSAYQLIEKQVSFGPRVPNTQAHEKCGFYLTNTLKNSGWEVQTQEFNAKAFDGTSLRLKNIIASYNPKVKKRVLLAAHWDTRPFADQDDESKMKVPIDGANDGGSGVGVLLEIARAISSSDSKLSIGVDIILFDGEDYGQPDFAMEMGWIKDSWCLGSQYWAKNKHQADYLAFYGILLDMVGARNAKFAKEGISMRYAPSVVKKVWETAHQLGFQGYFIDQQSPAITDDHVYVNEIAGIPMIDIIEFNTLGQNYFGDYWHTHADNMDIIDKATLDVVGQTVLTVLYNE